MPEGQRRTNINRSTAFDLEQRHPRDMQPHRELNPCSTLSTMCSRAARRPLLEIKVRCKDLFVCLFDLTTLREKRKAKHNSPVYKQLLD